MQTEYTTISVGGTAVRVPVVRVRERTVVCTGRALKIARVDDEEWTEDGIVDDPEAFISGLRASPLKADVFTFAQAFWEAQPRFSYRFEWEDVAAVPITTYADWWQALPQESRKNVRRAERRGMVVKLVGFDDDLVRGIKGIYDETPIRQGRRFWHFGKDLEVVKRENSSFLDRCDFVGAYHEGELIGFIKTVYVGRVGRIMQILARNSHLPLHAPNALLAKAMEACCQRGMKYFVYGQYIYGNKGDTPIAEFKRRNGFQRLQFPRYFVPLSVKGRVAVSLRLHRGAKRLLPAPLTRFLAEARARVYRRTLRSAALPASKQAPVATGIVGGRPS